jgi:hypothetical protein
VPATLAAHPRASHIAFPPHPAPLFHRYVLLAGGARAASCAVGEMSRPWWQGLPAPASLPPGPSLLPSLPMLPRRVKKKVAKRVPRSRLTPEQLEARQAAAAAVVAVAVMPLGAAEGAEVQRVLGGAEAAPDSSGPVAVAEIGARSPVPPSSSSGGVAMTVQQVAAASRQQPAAAAPQGLAAAAAVPSESEDEDGDESGSFEESEPTATMAAAPRRV